MPKRFVQYVGPPDLHDAEVVDVEHRGDVARVTVRSYEGRRFVLEFSGVVTVEALRPVGMILYAVVEVAVPPPHRGFEFAAADEDAGSRLAIIGDGFVVRGDGMPPLWR